MADSQKSRPGAGSHQQPSRLQRRAPSSLKISPTIDWNVAIPLLSPLASSPPAVELIPAASSDDARQQDQQCHHSAESEKVVFKTWKHPAAPFCYEPAPPVPPFVPV